MSTTLSIRLPEETKAWLKRRTMKMGTPGTAAARLLEEAKRREQFPGVTFRDTPEGRLPFLSESRIALDQFQAIAESFASNPKRISKAYPWPLWKIQSALSYLEQYRDELESEFDRDPAADSFAELKSRIPNLEVLP